MSDESKVSKPTARPGGLKNQVGGQSLWNLFAASEKPSVDTRKPLPPAPKPAAPKPAVAVSTGRAGPVSASGSAGLGVTAEVATLGFILAFYGIFVGFVAAGTFEPCTIAGAFDVSDAECKAGFEKMQKIKGYGANLTHAILLTTRLEGYLWMAIGLSAGAALKMPELRPGVLAVSAAGCLLAAYVHMQHEGLVGAAPWHAASHPFNMTLITVDLVVGGAALFCLTQGKKAKAKLF